VEEKYQEAWNGQARLKIKYNKKRGAINKSQATALFRLYTGHDLRGDYLEKLYLAPSNICTLC
jgi:hypothetical protein